MTTRELDSNIKRTQVLDPATLTSTTNTASVDNQGYESLVIDALVGESGDTLSGSVYFTGKLQESDDNSAWTDVSNDDVHQTANLFTVDAAAEDDALYSLSYKGDKRYVRLALTFTGTHSNGIPIGAVALQGHADILPVS